MCTVSYIPSENGEFVLTSNRDESKVRSTFSPVQKIIGTAHVLFPEDGVSGGTWIALNQYGRVCCLLNGAFENHSRQSNYLKSRGRIILELMEFQEISDYLEAHNFHGIEPFTLIIVEQIPVWRLVEIRWDGTNTHIKYLETKEPHIWSSATLYSPEIRRNRERWFNEWLMNNETINPKAIMDFHTSVHDIGVENDLIMTRSNGLQTVSITQIEAALECCTMTYLDLLTDTVSRQTLTTLDHV